MYETKEFTRLLNNLKNNELIFREERMKTKLGVIYVGNLNYKKIGNKKAEIVGFNFKSNSSPILKLESLIVTRSRRNVLGVAIQIFDDGYRGINYSGMIKVYNPKKFQESEKFNKEFFNDFRINAKKIFELTYRITENENPNSRLLLKLEKVMSSPIPDLTPRIQIKSIR